MMAGRSPPGPRKVIRQQAQSYSAGGLRTVGTALRVLWARGKRTQSTFHPRPVIYNDSTARRAVTPHSRGVDNKPTCPLQAVDHALGAPTLLSPGAYTPARPCGALYAADTVSGTKGTGASMLHRRCPNFHMTARVRPALLSVLPWTAQINPAVGHVNRTWTLMAMGSHFADILRSIKGRSRRRYEISARKA